MPSEESGLRGSDEYMHMERAYAVLENGNKVDIPYTDDLKKILGIEDVSPDFSHGRYGSRNLIKGRILTDMSDIEDLLESLRETVNFNYESELEKIEYMKTAGNLRDEEGMREQALKMKERQLYAIDNSVRIGIEQYDRPLRGSGFEKASKLFARDVKLGDLREKHRSLMLAGRYEDAEKVLDEMLNLEKD